MAFDDEALFYRAWPDRPLTLQVMVRRTMSYHRQGKRSFSASDKGLVILRRRFGCGGRI